MVDRLEPYRQWLGDSMKPSGNGWYMAKCPSHDDKHRSLAISQKGHHHCKAGCGEKGDSYIVAQKVGLDHRKYARGNVKSDNKTPSTPKIKPRNSSPEPPSTNGGVPDVYLENKEPTLGSIEHAEWQQKMDEISRLADIMIGKQRHGPTGNVKVEFEAMYTKFKNLEKSMTV